MTESDNPRGRLSGIGSAILGTGMLAIAVCAFIVEAIGSRLRAHQFVD